ncbi:MAG: hypothetical protein U0W24_11470 [Bacteroidales bacterium]
MIFYRRITTTHGVSVFPGLIFQKSVSGSVTGGIPAMITMLNFAARHKIMPQVEHFKFSQLSEALDKLRKGDVRYRIVLSH